MSTCPLHPSVIQRFPDVRGGGGASQSVGVCRRMQRGRERVCVREREVGARWEQPDRQTPVSRP